MYEAVAVRKVEWNTPWSVCRGINFSRPACVDDVRDESPLCPSSWLRREHPSTYRLLLLLLRWSPWPRWTQELCDEWTVSDGGCGRTRRNWGAGCTLRAPWTPSHLSSDSPRGDVSVSCLSLQCDTKKIRRRDLWFFAYSHITKSCLNERW